AGYSCILSSGSGKIRNVVAAPEWANYTINLHILDADNANVEQQLVPGPAYLDGRFYTRFGIGAGDAAVFYFLNSIRYIDETSKTADLTIRAKRLTPFDSATLQQETAGTNLELCDLFQTEPPTQPAGNETGGEPPEPPVEPPSQPDVSEGTVIINPAKDTFVLEAEPNTNFGGSQHLWISQLYYSTGVCPIFGTCQTVTTYPKYVTLVAFSLDSLNQKLPAGARVISATLLLYEAPPTQTVVENEISYLVEVNAAWNEETLIWNTASAYTSRIKLPTRGILEQGEYAWVWDVTSAVQDARNTNLETLTLILKKAVLAATPTPPDPAYTVFWSSESNKQPKLRIRYKIG
ncbi:DNRLRE domain-containing protein, partial [archaeon]|nr:DNRLRE domain-containing protein [archaeon]